MKTKLFSIALLSLLLVNCGGEEKKEEAPKQDSTVAEEPKEPAYEYTYQVSEVDVEPRWVVTIGDSTMLSDVPAFFQKNMPMVGKTAGMKEKDMTQPPLGIYYNLSPDKKFYTKAAIVITDSTRKVKAPGKLEKLPATTALKVVYLGDYMKMDKAYADLTAYAAEKGMTPTGLHWEQYMNDPMTEKDTAKWQTDIYLEVKPAAGE